MANIKFSGVPRGITQKREERIIKKHTYMSGWIDGKSSAGPFSIAEPVSVIEPPVEVVEVKPKYMKKKVITSKKQTKR